MQSNENNPPIKNLNQKQYLLDCIQSGNVLEFQDLLKEIYETDDPEYIGLLSECIVLNKDSYRNQLFEEFKSSKSEKNDLLTLNANPNTRKTHGYSFSYRGIFKQYLNSRVSKKNTF